LSIKESPPVPHDKRSHLTAVGLLFAAAILWSFGGVLVKGISWNPMAIAGTRSLLALPLLIGFACWRGYAWRWSWSYLLGGMAYSAAVTLFVISNKLTTAANAIMLQYTAPVYVALLSAWILKERATRRDWLTILMAFAGIALFFFDRMSAGALLGNILALLAGLAFAVLTLAMRSQKDASPVGSIIVGNLLTGLICLPFMFQSAPPASNWILLVVLGVFQLGLSYLCFASAMKRATAIEGITIPIIEPVLNPLWAFLILGERPGFWAIPGGILVVAAVLFRAISSVRGNAAKDKTSQGG
jgi:drug/metabolite transporter (DMT)-like permease